MRRRIRITESQLRRTVNEAVRGLLREMDYKTPLSAGYEAERQGDFERAAMFRRYGDELANKQYGYTGGRIYPDHIETAYVDYRPKLDDDYYSAVEARLDRNSESGWDHDNLLYANDGVRRNKILHNINNYNEKGNAFSDISFDDENPNYNEIEDYYFQKYSNRPYHDDFRSAYDRAKEEADHYTNGDYEYRKGQGWRLKNESRRRR